MARRRASMREGPLAELFRATEAAQRQAEREGAEQPPAQEQNQQEAIPVEPHEETVEHVPSFEQPQPAAQPPVRDSGPEEGVRGNREVPPAQRAEPASEPAPLRAVPEPEPE